MTHDLFSGAAAPSFDDPLGMLQACHGRIRRQLVTLARLQRHLPEHGCDDDARAAARAILRYFDTAAPHHHADEEASVFPRVVARAADAKPVVARLEADHEALAANWRHLRPLLAAIAAGERANLDAHTVHEVDAAYASHIAVEEDELIPLAREVLTAEEIAAIGREMAARRNVTPRP
jgi:hemerythrin-like domain-containing protein